MKKTAALVLLAAASLLTACDPFTSSNPDSIHELCLQDGFTPCRDQPPTDLTD